MKKFEEEAKGKVETMATQPGCSMTRKVWYNADDIHALSDGWKNPEYVNKLKRRNEQLDGENLALHDKIEDLQAQLDSQQPEIPRSVAKFIKYTAEPIYEICAWADHYGDNGSKCDDPDLAKTLDWFGMNRNLFYKAVINGYTVAKEKRFYLKNKFTGNYLSSVPESNNFYHIMVRDPNVNGLVRSFTQQEIESLETGSYEQIPVEEDK